MGMLAERERERERGVCSARCYQMVLSFDLIYQTLILKGEPNTRNVKSTMVIAHDPIHATIQTTNVDIF